MKIMTESYGKSKSVLILSLILLSPVLLLITPQAAHAASPTLSLSITSGPGAALSTAKITGTGFPALAANTGLILYFKSTSKTLSTSGATSVQMYGQSLVNVPSTISAANCQSGSATATAPCGDASVDGNGAFAAYFDTPTVVGDTYNVWVTYQPSGGSLLNSSPVTFTITPYLDVRLADDLAGAALIPTSRTGHFGSWVRISYYGFGNAETVTISGLQVPTGTTVSQTSLSTGSYNGYLFERFLSETTGGSKTFTAVGSTTGLTATRSFTIVPSIALFNSQTSTTLVSIAATAPASVFLALHGFANAETISAATVGGVTASFGAVTTASDGSYGTTINNHLPILYTSSIPFGATSMTLTGSVTGTVTFNAANANVINPFAQVGGSATVSETDNSLSGTNSLKVVNVPIIASASQTGSTATSIIGLSESSGFVGDTLVLYLAGWQSLNTISTSSGVTYQVVSGTDAAQTATCGKTIIDANGAAECSIAVPASLRGAHTVKVTTTGGGSTNPGTTFTVKPLLQFSTYKDADSAAGYATFTYSGTASTTSTPNYGYVSVQGTGFGATSSAAEALSLSIGSTLVSASFVTPGSTGSFTAQALTNGLSDLAAGSYAITSSGATTGDNATGYDYYDYNSVGTTVTTLVVVPNFGANCGSSACSMSVAAGANVNQGQTISLQTSTTAGIHGLKPSSSYTVYMDSVSGTKLTTFTSTSGGAVPAGTQVTIPSASSGTHVLDFVQSGSSVVIGQTIGVLQDIANDDNAYGQIYVTVQGTITVTPSAGGVGTLVALSGTGIVASASYTVQIDTAGTTTSLNTKCTQGTAGCVSYAGFTSTSAGAIPSGINFTMPALAATTEAGSSVKISIYNTGTNTVDATGTFLLQATMTLSSATAAPGSVVSVTANGLDSIDSKSYNIIWNAGVTSNGVTSGTIVAAFTPRSDGSAAATFTVPSTAAAGAYSVQLLRTDDSFPSSTQGFRLVSPPTLTVSVGGPSLTGTSTFTAGTPSQISLSGSPALQITYTNNVVSAVTGVVYAVVHNAAGQTVYYTTATVTPAAGATATAYLVLAGLPSGTYSVTIFAVTPSGVVISATSTATATF